MVKKKDLMKIYFVYVCLCHVCPAHPCGENPLRLIQFISIERGLTLQSVLRSLRSYDERSYKIFERLYEDYAQCVGMVDTGYFKRSGDSFSENDQKVLPASVEDESLQLPNLNSFGNMYDDQFRNKKLSRDSLLRQILKRTSYLINEHAFQERKDATEDFHRK